MKRIKTLIYNTGFTYRVESYIIIIMKTFRRHGLSLSLSLSLTHTHTQHTHTLSLSLSLSLSLAIYPYQSLLLISPLDCIQSPLRADECKFLLIGLHQCFHVLESIKEHRPWCNGYRRRNWTRRHEFKSWTRLIAFHIALIPLGKVWI